MAKLLCVMKNGLLGKLIQKIDFKLPEVPAPEPVRFVSADNVKKIGKGSKYVEVFAATVPALGSAKGPLSDLMKGIVDGSGFSLA